MPANPEITEYIRQAAIRRGIDPDTALRVAQAEALNVFDPNQPDRGGDEGSSFGPFQLHYAGMSRNMPNAGLGDEFTAATGLDARDPSTWRQQIDFSLDHAAKKGWSAWMGAKAAGVGPMQGINGGGGGGGSSPPVGVSPTAVAQNSNDDARQAMVEALATRDSLAREEPARPKSLLADTLASSVRQSNSSGTGGVTPDATDQFSEMAVPTPTDFAPSAVPETAPARQPETPVVQTAQPTPLADLFTVKDIGVETEIDPVTGRPRPYRSRRAYG